MCASAGSGRYRGVHSSARQSNKRTSPVCVCVCVSIPVVPFRCQRSLATPGRPWRVDPTGDAASTPQRRLRSSARSCLLHRMAAVTAAALRTPLHCKDLDTETFRALLRHVPLVRITVVASFLTRWGSVRKIDTTSGAAPSSRTRSAMSARKSPRSFSSTSAREHSTSTVFTNPVPRKQVRCEESSHCTRFLLRDPFTWRSLPLASLTWGLPPFHRLSIHDTSKGMSSFAAFVCTKAGRLRGDRGPWT